jgi:hypothetical protein
MSKDAVVPSRRRPLSVWVLTIANVLIAIVLIAASFKGEDWGFPTAQVAFWGLLGIGISISAHMAWYGSRLGRNLLLILSTVYLAVLLYSGLRTIAWVNTWSGDAHVMARAVLWVGFAILMLAANFTFLLGKRAREFFS